MTNPCNNGVKVTNSQVVVVMVPLPAQGHLNQLLQLSLLIASHNIPVHYVGTATHNRQAQLRAHRNENYPDSSIANIHFHEFPMPSFATPPPNPNSSSKFPSQLIPSFIASLNLREPVLEMLKQLSRDSKRVIVIFDSLMAWVVQDIPSIPNAEPYCFQSVSAFCVLSFHYQVTGGNFPNGAGIILKDLPSREECYTPEFLEFSKIQFQARKFNYGNLYNTCKVIEGPFLDILAKENVSETNKQWSIGPFNRVAISTSKKRHECLEWLDKKAPNSVIFVSFGTTTSLPDEQIQEIAIGLQQSEQNFILVIREADKGDVFVGDDRKVQLPEGYKERIKGKGFIIRDWAPQLDILGHPSTGGFMSHCGWNSCMEGISMGVPIAAWPMHSDQPHNALLVAEVLNIGVIVNKYWTRNTDDHQEIVRSKIIENCVKRLLASPEGEEMRQKAVQLSKAVKESIMEGGTTQKEMDSFISHITR
uniref:Glycosyltransferase n=1 Tax=Nemophila menziesii TaxID=79376 RepID=A0A387II11_NEMME|nr:glucosyltransferase 5 [Nemophila menziesii]